MALAAGTHLGTYEIVSPLGEGGMGEVYRALDTKLGRSVAIKVLSEAFLFDQDRINRFEREAKVLASLNHPHVATLHGMEESDGRHFLVMELVEGETLADRIAVAARGRTRSRGLDVADAMRIARQIALALEAAHEKGIVHRDLKPANVKITPDDAVKVLDFGLAKAVDSAEWSRPPSAGGLTHSPTLTFAGATQAGMILGTAPYMSPEQAKGRSADRRSDVWAFGCVLFEMLAGRRAFEGEDVSETLASVLKSEPDWSALPATLPREIRALVEGCLRKDRRERIGDISTALFLLNQPLSVASTPAPTASSRLDTRRAVLLAVAGLVTGGALVAAAGFWRPRAPAPAPVARFEIPLPPGQQLALPRLALAISPDGREIVFASGGRLYQRAVNEIETRPIPGSDAAFAPVFSPDGKWLMFWSSPDATLKKIPAGGGTPTTICPISPAPSGISWDADGILFAEGSTGILRVSADGGKPQVVIPLDNLHFLAHGPQQLPGGQILFTITRRTGSDVPWDQADIVVQSLATGERRTLIHAGADARYVPTGHLVYAQSGTLFAVPFDVSKLAVTGGPVPVLEGVARATSISGGTAHFAFSAAGSLVFVPGPPTAGRQDIMLFDRKGGSEALNLPAGTYAYPRVSPDGRRLAVEVRTDKETNISVYDLAGTSAIRRVTFGGNNRFPVWSADGRRIAFQSDREGDLAIYSQPADGGAAERLTKPEPAASHVPEAWSPSGDTLLFSVTSATNVSLWTFSTRDRKVAPFDDVKSSNFGTDAMFSPDGRWVAYQIGEPGEGEGTTFVQPFPPNGTKYEIARGGRPLWSRDGTELFFVPAPGEFMSVKVATNPAFAFSTPTAVPRGFGIADPISPRPYDAMPDGRIIGLGATTAAADTKGPPHLQVVLNWFTELQQRAPTRQ